jgi:hypothetical protein
MLDAIRAEVAGDDQPQGIAVQPGQLFAIHFISEQAFAIQAMIDVERLYIIRCLRDRRAIQTIEGDLPGAGSYAGLFEHVLQTNPFQRAFPMAPCPN